MEPEHNETPDHEDEQLLVDMFAALKQCDTWFEPLRTFQKQMRSLGLPDAAIAELGRLAMTFIEAGAVPPKGEDLLIAALEPTRDDCETNAVMRSALHTAGELAREGATIAKPRRALRKRICTAKNAADTLLQLPESSQQQLAANLRAYRRSPR